MLYKQGNQKIEIIVRRDAGGGDTGTNGLSTQKAASSQSGNTDLGPNIDDNKAGVKQKTLGKFVGAGVIQLGKQAAFRGFDYFVSGISMRNGDQALQDQIGRKIEIVQDVVNVGTSVISGAMMGSAFGPVGTIFGGIIGLASSGMNIGFRQMERERSYNYEIFKQNNAIQYQRARAEINLTTGRLR